jgi:uncharacterized integral membrane protein
MNTPEKDKRKTYWAILKLLIYIGIPIVVLLLPMNYFDTGDSICLSVRIFDQECYACGMTSAFMHLIHLDFETAFAYNMLSFIALPLIAILWISASWKEAKYLYSRYQNTQHYA